MADACSGTCRTPASELSFIAGGSEMAERICSFDWSKTSIGVPQRWPQSLKTAVSICLGSRYPIVIWWGKEALTQFYNDAYISFLGPSKHPRALGQSARVCWNEIWHIIDPMLEGVFATGEATWSEDFLYVITRNLPREEGYFTFSYSPIRDDTGAVGGIFCACYETTGRVVGERRLKTLRDLGRVVMEPMSAAQACQITAQTLARNPADIPFALIYLLDGEGRQVRLVAKTGLETGSRAALDRIDLREGADQSATWPLRRVFKAAAAELVSDIATRFGPLPGGPWPESPQDALVLPIAAPGQPRPTGFLVAGLSPRRVVDAEYRSFFDLIASHLATAIANAHAHEAEKQRAEALAEINRAKTAFFSNVSHEFRTPLTLIIGPLQDTLATTGLPPPAYERLDVARRNSQRLLKLVNTLLDFSRIEAGRAEAVYEPLDLATYTAELAGVFRSAFERAGMTLIVECPPLPEPVYADREMWEKVVFNLLSNAFKFTFEGTITVVVRRAGETVELTVSDTGAGIPTNELPHIFERFYRAKEARGRSYEGSGIGLALVQELVKLHGGSVHVRSEVDQGSAFTIRIPTGNAHVPAERIGAARTLPSTSLRGAIYLEEALQWLPDDRRPSIPELATEISPTLKGSHILVADDNADMRKYLRRLFAQSGCHVVVVSDGEAALEASREMSLDLVLADVMMPKLDGFKVLAALRRSERTQFTPIILLSARAGEEARVEGMAAGADDYLVKPFSARELLARVEAHLKLVRLRREEQKRAAADLDAMTRLRDLGELCAATNIHPERPLEAILDTAIALTGADKGNIQLLDSDSGTLRIAVNRGFDEPFLRFFARVDVGDPAVCGAALQAKGRIIVADVTQGAIFAGQPSQQVMLDADVRAVQSTPLTSSAGQVFGMISTHFRVPHWPSERDLRLLDLVARQAADYLERKEANAKQAQLAAIVDSASDAIIAKTLDGIVTSWNRAAERLFGYAANEMIGQSIRRVIPADRQHEEDKILERLAAGECIEHYDTVRVAKDSRTIDVSLTISPVRDAAGRIIGASKIARDITEMKARQERIQLLMRELNHRSKNILSLVQSIARQTSSPSREDFIARFSQRLRALAANHDLLVQNEWRGVGTHDLARVQLAPFADLIGQRIFLEGPELTFTPAAAQAVGLALHELATNAGKYGALANAKGRVDVAWACDRGTFSISWTERNGPRVRAPKRRGFGSAVISSLAEMSVEGTVDLQYRPTGLEWRLACPADKALERGAAGQLVRA
jgi:PAS domain S-box-containing protein